MHVRLDLPTQLPLLPAVTTVATWAAHSSPFGADPAWRLVVDDDATIGLVPVGPETTSLPALLIATYGEEDGGGFDVTACDPDHPVELGLFATIEESLDGIAAWLAPQHACRTLH
jgi:hypothetical protein